MKSPRSSVRTELNDILRKPLRTEALHPCQLQSLASTDTHTRRLNARSSSLRTRRHLRLHEFKRNLHLNEVCRSNETYIQAVPKANRGLPA